MKWLPFLMSILLLSAADAQARLGETREQTEARYGLPKRERTPEGEPPLLEGARELIFHHAGFSIRCALLPATDGLEYIVREEYAVLKTRDLHSAERDAMLQAEASGHQWTMIRTGQSGIDFHKVMVSKFTRVTDTGWVRSDGATACMAMANRRMRFELPHAWKWEQQRQVAQESKTKAAVPQF